MTTSTNSDAELLTEHFGYPPISLIDDIINSVNVLAERALNSVEQGLLNAPPATIGFKPPKSSSRNAQKQQQQQQQDPAEAAKTEIESGTHQLETLLCASIDRNFDKFEIYVLRNILTVRPPDIRHWIRLSHYEGLDLAAAAAANPSDQVPSLDSINHLRRKLRESMRLNALLTAERARNEKLLAELQDIVGVSAAQVKSEKNTTTTTNTTTTMSSPNSQAQSQSPARKNNNSNKSPFAFLHRKGSLTAGGSEAPLSTTTAFTLSQMQALRALSTSLRTIAPDLVSSAPPPPPTTNASSSSEAMDIDSEDRSGNGNGNGNGEKSKDGRKSWRRERLEYVEGATRRYLETVEGLELGRHGEVRDGEWQGAGRNLARDEVGGLEGVVGLLGGGVEEGQGQEGQEGGGEGGGEKEGNSTAAAAAAGGTARKTRSSSRDDRMDES
ncbi:Mis12 protein-domain-containing protein [Daldinia caldariorum]|uniref:Mis12 protein-domain-containing protein n=1 Tax=Daldinia caldariorum TaxID=326644 RepID=UPI002007F6E2|nr:Mis12 protein-domain-containing protein [Daldinia caldariorum]KAI1467029.1 Mis12 protein-domain-containing protein [Daldinia caldariorum]